MKNSVNITQDEIDFLQRLKNYFGENDKTQFEHTAFSTLNNLLSKVKEANLSDSGNKMKLFKIDFGEIEHVGANDILEAIKFYVKETGCDLQEMESIDEVPEGEWCNLIISYDEVDEQGNQIKIPTNEVMKTVTSPEIICSTAW